VVYTAAPTRPLELPPVPVINVRAALPWLTFAALLLAVLYVVVAEQGAAAVLPGSVVHEFVHDARHLLGVPCH